MKGEIVDKRIDVLSIGEILIDFTPAGLSSSGEALYERNPGGAPANVAVAVSRLGGSAAFAGKVGDDSFGRYLKETLVSSGVDTRGLAVSREQHTTLAFVSLSDKGERDFSFCRNPGADCLLSPDELDVALIRKSRIIHTGSLSFTHEPLRETTLTAIHEARAAGVLVSCDPNWRESLWPDRFAGIHAMKELVSLSDVVKLSDVELALVSGLDENDAESFTEETIIALAKKILKTGPALVTVTRGAAGSCFCFGDCSGNVPSFASSVVDTTGAGDAFAGALLYCLSRRDALLDGLSEDMLRQDLLFANAAASLCVQKRGAIPAMPYPGAVQDILNQ